MVFKLSRAENEVDSLFENDVKMYGIQTKAHITTQKTRLRMM